MKHLTIGILLLISYLTAISQTALYNNYDEHKYYGMIGFSVKLNLKSKPINQIVIRVGEYFLNTKYVGGVCDAPDTECLVANLYELDCVTLVENVLAISLCIKNQTTSFDDYLAMLQKIRYRNGIINGYASRLHYFSDWIYYNSLNNFVADVTQACGGKPVSKPVHFMSSNSAKYRHLNNNTSLTDSIKATEQEINNRGLYYIIPKEEVAQLENNIEHGDIIAIATNTAGLDYTHTGIAYKKNDRIYLLHASLTHKKVEISDVPLSEYLTKIKSHTGISVIRIK